MNLVIVESPTKARKLKGYLGKDFKVEASVGHVRDLPRKKLGVDVDKKYQPVYEVSENKQKVVAKLRKLAADSDKIYLAMDPDREGEAIAWHVKHLLQYNDQDKKLKSFKKDNQFLRSTFHEITKPAVLASIGKPSEINYDLVDAQQARRILDRLVGYQVSPVLWKKVRRGLSAGRVQSVALRLIVEREKEIKAFKPEEYWEFSVALSKKDSLKKQEIFSEGRVKKDAPKTALISVVEKKNGKKFSIDNKKDASTLIDFLEKADYQVTSVDKTERQRQSLPPFTTSLLQQSAATQLGFSAKQTMRLAQQLYEEGLITYHRTDSFNLAQSAINAARQHIELEYGPEYLSKKARVFTKKSKNAQEAHEAIRITHLEITKEQIPAQGAKLTDRHARLYDLIWRRFVASQMSPALYDQTTVLVTATKKAAKNKYELKTVGSVMKFKGWRRLFNNSEDRLLPDLAMNDDLDFLDQNPLQKFTQPPARFNDASLVKELEKRGIGRPSTYASIISVIVDRGYIDRQERKFFATSVGITVSDFLVKHFDSIMDYDFTAKMEEDLDQVSLGKEDWVKVVDEFYQPLAKKIEKVTDKAPRMQVPVEKTGEKCPDCQKLVETGELKKSEAGEIVIRSGRFGKFKSCSRFPDCKFTENIIETLPGQHCPLCGKGDVIVRNTRWGKPFFGCSCYPKCDWASWKKPAPDYKVSKKEWAEIKKRREEWKKKMQKAKDKKEAAADTKKTTKKTSKKKSTKKKTASKKKTTKK